MGDDWKIVDMTHSGKLPDIVFDTRLINLVKKFPALYNRNNDDHKNTIYKKQVWQAISENLQTDDFICLKRWMRIRDRYVVYLKREIQNINPESIKWPYYEMCSFLREHTQLYVNIHALIKSVRRHPVLYDRNENGYKDRELKRFVWQNIAKEIKSYPELCTKEWNKLYNKYINELRRILSSSSKTIASRWGNFTELAFLKDYVCVDNSDEVSQQLESKDIIPNSTLSMDSGNVEEDISNSSDEIFKCDFWNRPAVSCDEILLNKTTPVQHNIASLQNAILLDHNYSILYYQQNGKVLIPKEESEEMPPSPQYEYSSIPLNDQIIAEEFARTSENRNISHMNTLDVREDYILDSTLPDTFYLQTNSNRQQSKSENATFVPPTDIDRSSSVENLIPREDDTTMEIMEDTNYCPLMNSIPKEDFLNNIQMEDQQKKVSTSEIMNPTDFGSKFFHDEDIERKKQKNIVKENKTLQNLDDKIENGNSTNIPCDIKFFTELVACKITDLPETYRDNVIRKIKQYLEIHENNAKDDL